MILTTNISASPQISLFLIAFNHVQDMSKTLAIWFFLFNIIIYSAYGSTRTAETREFMTSKQQKETKRNQL